MDTDDGPRSEDGPERAPHVPVLAEQVPLLLARPEVAWILDGTLGAGGHSALLLEACPAAQLLGLDRDPDALAIAQERLAPFGERARTARATYAEAPEAAAAAGAGPFDAILLDLGVSSMQLDRAERGFSFQQEGPLDMRMNPEGETTAADLVNQLEEEPLANLIYQLGEERLSRRIARAIVAERQIAPFTTTERLAEVVKFACPPPRWPKGKGKGKPKGKRRTPIHPATRTFQALRMAVNDELGQLERGLPALFALLAPGGRLGVISFHSLEDRPVKHTFRAWKQEKLARVLTKKPLIATESEVASNPRSRSAKLRVVERLPV